MKKIYSFMKLLFLLTVLIFSRIAFSQTTLISPTGDGGFENGADFAANGWTVENGSATPDDNQWYLGTSTATGMGTGNVAYISNNTGTETYAYSISSPMYIVHFYRDVTFPAGETIINLSFLWKGTLETSPWDGLQVSLAPTSVTPVASAVAMSGQISSSIVSGATYVGNALYYNQSYPATANIFIPSALAGNATAANTMRLIFTFRLDASMGDQPPIAIDNISLTSLALSPLSGVYTINNTLPTSGTNFMSFTDAINSLNVNGISSSVTFNVAAGQTFNEKPPVITATGTSLNTITFKKNGAGLNPKITPTGVLAGMGPYDYGFCISGGDYITFDGIDVDASAATGITSAIEYGYLLRNASSTNGAQYNTIKNCAITLNKNHIVNVASACIVSSASTSQGGFAPANVNGANSFNKYYNLTLQNAQNGVYLIGNTAFPDLSCEVGVDGAGCQTSHNLITNMGGVYTSSVAYGIYAFGQNSIKIFNNNVNNVSSNQANGAGIFVASYFGTSEIFNNNVNTIAVIGSSTTTGRASGIEVQNGAGTPNIRVYNNFIYGITSSYTSTASSTFRAWGIYVNNTTTAAVAEIDNNNIYLETSGTPTYSLACFGIANTTIAVHKVRGNNFVNAVNAQGATAKHVCWFSPTTSAIGGAGSFSDYNNLFIVNDAGTSGFIGRCNTTNYAALSNWQAATFTPDLNSLSVNPMFTSSTDLHVSNLALSEVSGFTPQSWITTDIDCDDRLDLTPSDIGADAFGPDITAPTVSFVPVNGSTGVFVGDNVVLTFSEAVRKTDNSAIDASVVTFYNNTDAASVPFTASYNDKILTISPNAALLSFKSYTVSVSGVEDIHDNALTGANATTFTTGDADITPPLYVSSSVEHAAPSNVVVQFNEYVELTSAAGFTITVNGSPISINSFSGNSTSIITFNINTIVPAHQVVSIQYNQALGNVTDRSGNVLASFAQSPVTNNVKSSAKDFLSFSFLQINNPSLIGDVTGVINANSIDITLNSTVVVTGLIPTFTTSPYTLGVLVGATVQTSGVTPNNFTSVVTYTVKAEDGTAKNYTININYTYVIPYSQGFDGSAKDWTFFNNGTGNSWEFTTESFHSGTGSLIYNYHPTNPADAWAFSPEIQLIGGKIYSLTFFENVINSTYHEKLKITVGQGATIFDQMTTLFDYEFQWSGWQTFTVIYDCPLTGGYNFAFNCHSDADRYKLLIDDLLIREADTINDLASISSDFGVLQPTFNSAILDYTLSLPSSQQTLPNITWTEVSPYSYAEIDGFYCLLESEYYRTAHINVTSESGATKQYRVLLERAAYSVNSSSHNFGATIIGDTSLPKAFYLHNSGYGFLNIENAVIIGTNASEFKFVNPNTYPYAISTTDSLPIIVEFTPTSKGNKNAILRIKEVDNATWFSIPLTGFAPNNEKEIISFNIASQASSTIIDASAHTIYLEMPIGSSHNQIANFSISSNAVARIGAATQTSGVTSNNFSNPIVYTITAQDGTTQDWMVTVYFIVGVQNIASEKAIKVYPNPAKDLLYINFEELIGTLNITLTNIQGKEIIKEQIVCSESNFTHPLVISNIPSGVYILKIINKDFYFLRRIVVK